MSERPRVRKPALTATYSHRNGQLKVMFRRNVWDIFWRRGVKTRWGIFHYQLIIQDVLIFRESVFSLHVLRAMASKSLFPQKVLHWIILIIPKKGVEKVTLWCANKLCTGCCKGTCKRAGSLLSCSQYSQQIVLIPFSLLNAQLTRKGWNLYYRGLNLHSLTKVTESKELKTFKAKMLWCLISSGKSFDNKGQRSWTILYWESIGPFYIQNNITLWNVISLLLLLIWYLCQHKLVIPKSTEKCNMKPLLSCLLLFSMP